MNINNSTILPQSLIKPTNQRQNSPANPIANNIVKDSDNVKDSSTNNGLNNASTSDLATQSSLTKLNVVDNQTSTSFSQKPKQTLRFINQTAEGLSITEFGQSRVGASSNRDTVNQSSLNQSPQVQYQTNQQLLEREQIGELVGIDLFA